jgi:hypothetical protein
MINKNKEIISPNKNLENKYNFCEKICKLFLFKKNDNSIITSNESMVHPEIKNHYVKF